VLVEQEAGGIFRRKSLQDTLDDLPIRYPLLEAASIIATRKSSGRAGEILLSERLLLGAGAVTSGYSGADPSVFVK
jgi:hypothetical protein